MGFRIRPTIVSAAAIPQALDLAVPIEFNAGTDYWRLKWKGILREVRTGTYGLMGSKTATSGTGVGLFFASADNGYILMSKGGSNLFTLGSNNLPILRNSDDSYEIEHLATGEIVLRRNDTVVATATYVSSNSFSGIYAWESIFRRVANPSTGVPDLELEYIELQIGTAPTKRWSGLNISSPTNRFPLEGGDGSGDLIQTSSWPADNSEWIYYASGSQPQVGQSTFAISASVNTALAAFKIGSSNAGFSAAISYDSKAVKLASSTMAIAAEVFFGLMATKSGLGDVSAAVSVSSVIAMSKQGSTGFSVPVDVDFYMGTGDVPVKATFSVTATATVSLSASKVSIGSLSSQSNAAISTTAFKTAMGTPTSEATTSFSLSGTKISSTTIATAVETSFGKSSSKAGCGTFATFVTVSISVLGGNPAVVIPVTTSFVTTTTRHVNAITTASRSEYQLTTSSGGSIV